MRETQYKAMVGYFSSHPRAKRALKFIYRDLPYFLFAAYPILIIAAFFIAQLNTLRIILVPLCVLIFVTVIRKLINRKRPYEVFCFESVFHRDSAGESMPSRHTASAFIIAMTFLYANLWLGILMIIIAALISASRVLGGAHFFSDVLAGALLSVTAGIVFLFLI